MDKQKQLKYLIGQVVRYYSTSEKLRGITAFWKEKDNTVCLSFYFNGSFGDEDLEDAYDLGAGIIANFPNGRLEEKYIRLDYPKPLPDQELLAYYRNEKKDVTSP